MLEGMGVSELALLEGIEIQGAEVLTQLGICEASSN